MAPRQLNTSSSPTLSVEFDAYLALPYNDEERSHLGRGSLDTRCEHNLVSSRYLQGRISPDYIRKPEITTLLWVDGRSQIRVSGQINVRWRGENPESASGSRVQWPPKYLEATTFLVLDTAVFDIIIGLVTIGRYELLVPGKPWFGFAQGVGLRLPSPTVPTRAELERRQAAQRQANEADNRLIQALENNTAQPLQGGVNSNSNPADTQIRNRVSSIANAIRV